MNKSSIILLSGGLDSATVLYYARSKKFIPHALIFDYGQRHRKEIRHAVKIARHAKVPYKIVKITLPWLGSSLLDKTKKLPNRKSIPEHEIPSTYVPARNIIFLSFAVSYAESVKADHVFIGANAIDYSGYPDCRPKFFKAYKNVIREGLKSGVEGKRIDIKAPLLYKSKAQIVRLAKSLNVPLSLTWSCYKGGNKPCAKCDSCLLRQKGFEEAGVDES